MTHAPMLESYAIFRSRDPDETRAYLSSKHFGLDLPPGEAGALDARFNGVYLPGMYLGYVQYGAPVVLRAVGHDTYWIQLPVCGQFTLGTGEAEVVCRSARAAVASPTRGEYCRMRSDAGSTRLHVGIREHAMLAQLAVLLGEMPSAPLEFAPEIDLDHGYGRSLAHYLAMAITDFARPDMWSIAMMRAFEEMFITRFLLSHPNTYAQLLERRARPVSPRDVKRAIDYIEAHLADAISTADLARAAGVPGRTLFKHFRDTRGITPMGYVRNARFARVREALLRASRDDSVTAIALGLGFTHMGRFSVEYRGRYGESPSATLRKRQCET